ncbi:MAG TPA: hypothetical protein VN673_04335 [Clostridia bacterium]|nr:hypothetical protein [Clostridia bacterium]
MQGNIVFITGWDRELMLIETPFDTRPPGSTTLTFKMDAGLKLGIQGRRGLHYQLEYTDNLANPSWQSWQCLLLTNETQSVDVSTSSASRFFRVQQDD